MFKRIINVSLSFMLCASLSACGSTTTVKQKTPDTSSLSLKEKDVVTKFEKEEVEEPTAIELNQVLVDNDYVKVEVKKVEPTASGDYNIKMLYENKTDTDIMVGYEECSINGIMCDPFHATTVGSDLKLNDTVSWSERILNSSHLSNDDITCISFELHVYNNEEWLDGRYVDEQFTIYPNGEENAKTFVYEATDEDIVLCDNESCRIIVLGFSSNIFSDNVINMYFENKTDKNVYFKIDNMGVNGFSVSPYFIDTVTPHAAAFSIVSIPNHDMEENEITEINELKIPIEMKNKDEYETIFSDDFTLSKD